MKNLFEKDKVTTTMCDISPLPFELRALDSAPRYQNWMIDTVRPYLGQRILEIGAGIGNMSRWLPIRELLVLTEQDPVLLALLKKNLTAWKLEPSRTLAEPLDLSTDIPPSLLEKDFDTVVSFNVFEHITDDLAAFRRACQILKSSQAKGPKRLVTVVPAHNWALGSMDQTFGHVRRYEGKDFRRIRDELAPDAHLHFEYFNVVGLIGWVLTGLVFKKETFGTGSVKLFEAICPAIKPFDRLIHKKLRIPLGQSLVSVLTWQ